MLPHFVLFKLNIFQVVPSCCMESICNCIYSTVCNTLLLWKIWNVNLDMWVYHLTIFSQSLQTVLLGQATISGVARTSPMLGHSMGTLRLYELLREVRKLLGESVGIPQPPRLVLRSYRSEDSHTRLVIRIYIVILRRSNSRPFSDRFTINNATISSALVGHVL